MKRHVCATCVVLSVILSPSLWSQDLTPLGSEFQVNSYTTGAQRSADIAGSGQGSFLVVWVSTSSAGSDTDNFSVQARRYTASGTPIGGDFQVNTYTTSLQWQPAVAGDGEGNFVVVWLSQGSFGNDTNESIQAQRFNSAGSFLGSQFQVNTFTLNQQVGPDIAVGPDGDFLVVWQSTGSLGGDTSPPSIEARLYNAAGMPVGIQFQVNTYTNAEQAAPSVSSDAAGNFVVAWHSRGSLGTDSDGFSIQAQRFNAMGMPIGGEFQVNSETTGSQFSPDVAVDSAGNFMVVWEGSPNIQAQLFDADGDPVGAPFELTQFGNGTQPGVGVDGQSRFVVSWSDYGIDPYGGISARHIGTDGLPVGDSFQVNTFTTGRQYIPAVAANPQGDFVVVWESYGSFGSDNNSYSIQAQRLGFPVSASGFEDGDFTGWDDVFPLPLP